LGKLGEANAQRELLTKRYLELLTGVSRVVIPFQDLIGSSSSYHIFSILLDKTADRRKVIDRLKNARIQSSIHYPTIKDFTAYREMHLTECPVARQISERELTLPLYPTMSMENVQYVVDHLREALDH
jgi:dTDP-4-amino-4,6-dideoxygalactose transaminase